MYRMYWINRKNRMNRLPQVLVDYIWTFDNRYRLQYNECVYQLNTYFSKNRLQIRLQHEICLFNLPILQSFGKHYYQYILARLRQFGDCIPNENLQHLRITNNKLMGIL